MFGLGRAMADRRQNQMRFCPVIRARREQTRVLDEQGWPAINEVRTQLVGREPPHQLLRFAEHRHREALCDEGRHERARHRIVGRGDINGELNILAKLRHLNDRSRPRTQVDPHARRLSFTNDSTRSLRNRVQQLKFGEFFLHHE